MLLSICIVYGGFYWRVRIIKAQKKRLEAQVNERTEQLNSTNLKLGKEVDEHQNTIVKLKSTLKEIKTLSGLLPICANCKKIRDDKGYWNNLESYIQKHFDVSFRNEV